MTTDQPGTESGTSSEKQSSATPAAVSSDPIAELAGEYFDTLMGLGFGGATRPAAEVDEAGL